jgi:hypothetical protein
MVTRRTSKAVSPTGRRPYAGTGTLRYTSWGVSTGQAFKSELVIFDFSFSRLARPLCIPSRPGDDRLTPELPLTAAALPTASQHHFTIERVVVNDKTPLPDVCTQAITNWVSLTFRGRGA